ncbi:hypothetical protein FI667_g13867, partial [Globisporangium splendens]
MSSLCQGRAPNGSAEQQSLVTHPQQRCERPGQVMPAGNSIITSASVEKPTAKPRSGWKLVLVRFGQNLQSYSRMHGVLNDLDILELQSRELPDPVDEGERDDEDDRVTEKAEVSSSNAIRPLAISLQRSSFSSQRMTPEIKLIRREHVSSREDTLREAPLHTHRPVGKRHRIFSLRSPRYHNRKRRLRSPALERRNWKHQWPRRSLRSANALVRRGERGWLLWRSLYSITHVQITQKVARERSIESCAAMQFLDQLSALEAEISSLLLFVRDAANAKSGQPSAAAKVPINEHTQDLARAMKDARAQSLLRIPVVVESWVICAKWGAFWRNQRTEYACLCDDGILYFFSNEKRCTEYLFELARVRNGVTSNSGKKNIKENVPKSQIDFSKEGHGWSVRKGDTSMDTRNRHAFALFDTCNKLRHILDVNTKDEADAWVAAISAELSHNQLCTTLKSFFTPADHADTSQPNDTAKAIPDLIQLRQRRESLPQRITFKPGQRVKFSLRWLHAQMERLKHGARQQRLKSMNLNQAMKDFRRDSIQINGTVHPGTCMNQIFMTLMATIRRCLLSSDIRRDASKHGDSSKHKQLGSSCSLVAAEMVAMRLAKELLICSSRTNGEGDILDALHLVIPSDHFCICPKGQTMEPIRVRLSSQPSASIGSTFLVPAAGITIKMTYSIIPNDSCSNGSTNVDTDRAEHNPCDILGDIENGNATRCQATTKMEQFDVVGAYHKKLIGNFHNWEELEGDVSIEFFA